MNNLQINNLVNKLIKFNDYEHYKVFAFEDLFSSKEDNSMLISQSLEYLAEQGYVDIKYFDDTQACFLVNVKIKNLVQPKIEKVVQPKLTQIAPKHIKKHSFWFVFSLTLVSAICGFLGGMVANFIFK